MSLNLKHFAIIGSVAFFLIACGGNKDEIVDASDDGELFSGLDSQKISAQNVFNTIPSRADILAIALEAKSEYNVEYLNNPNEVSEYALENSRALNLGVYGADLNVASIYNQTQESMLFFKCVSILAKAIGVADSFDENMGDRMTSNQSNRDSTLSIITQAFKSADNTLRKNDRPGVSSLLVAGAWIEGIYVACKTANDTKNEHIIQEIYKQNESLDNLIELLKSSKLHEDATYVISDLQSIKTTINSNTNRTYTVEALASLDAKISALRTKIISTK